MKGMPRGFTLIEMMTVVALVAIILGLAAPAFTDMIARQRVRGVMDELVSDLAYARSEAVARGHELRMGFDSNSTTTCYSLFTFPNTDRCYCLQPAASRCEAAAVELKTVQVDKATSVELAASSPFSDYVRFSGGMGAPTPLGFVVDVTSSRSGKLRARITPTGQARVCSPDGSISGVPTCS